ncbi:hypothetical protein AbHV_ORF28 [Abalone herpesvirus Victoria/AUS/2009]|uniref:Uncharacterized protein n=1 Tax=Abalone herpesvirus (isolate Abalone/Australia/Victoria/2009) TaxID=1241371 RepID=K4JYF5_ABHV|nr:hypothetical protein AbHV_ORF28 [Abalone herpesvirus Victoria/AUS/2009]AFU90038.1 hypothetical protein AbHV_ORF28 [Abalone herpesvirus Victoria/AUS/2009]
MSNVVYLSDTGFKTLSAKYIALKLCNEDKEHLGEIITNLKTKSDPGWKILLTDDLHLLMSSRTHIKFTNGTESVKERYGLTKRPMKMNHQDRNLLPACMKTIFSRGFDSKRLLYNTFKEKCLWEMVHVGEHAIPSKRIDDVVLDRRRRFITQLNDILCMEACDPDTTDDNFFLTAMASVIGINKTLLNKSFGDRGHLFIQTNASTEVPNVKDKDENWRVVNFDLRL